MCCVLRGWKRLLHPLALELQVTVSGKRLETKFQSSGRIASGPSLQTQDIYFKTFWLLTRSRIAGSYGSSVFNRLNCQTMLQGSSTILQFFYFFLNNCYYLIFLIIITLVGVTAFSWWLFFLSLMTNALESFPMRVYLPLYIYFWRNFYSNSSSISKLGYVSFIVLLGNDNLLCV